MDWILVQDNNDVGVKFVNNYYYTFITIIYV